MLGLGLRMAQDVGAHRKKIYNATPSLADELWRRAVWCGPQHPTIIEVADLQIQ